jgi:poly(hydroxyalkanoate) granule-associated protein
MAEKVTDKLAALAETQIAEKVRESASQIWLAGLGAYAKAEAEGSKLFDALVQDGERIESKTRSYLDKGLSSAKEKVDDLRAKATGSWSKVERAFDERVHSALSRLNIPSQEDVDSVLSRIDDLTAEVERLAGLVAARREAASAAASASVPPESAAPAATAAKPKASRKKPSGA